MKSLLLPGAFVVGTTVVAFSASEYARKNFSFQKKKIFSFMDPLLKKGTRVVHNTDLVVGGVIAANAAVFTAFLLNPHSTFLHKHFMTRPYGTSSSLLLASFAHRSGIHLGLNMYVLLSVADPLLQILGPYTFLAFYTSTGVLSSFVSRAYHTARQIHIPSLGASGSILACFTLLGLMFPHAKTGIVFIPSEYLSFEAQSALWVVAGVSVVGMAAKNFLPRIDHAGHLGGMLGGLLFFQQVKRLVEQRKKLREEQALRMREEQKKYFWRKT